MNHNGRDREKTERGTGGINCGACYDGDVVILGGATSGLGQICLLLFCCVFLSAFTFCCLWLSLSSLVCVYSGIDLLCYTCCCLTGRVCVDLAPSYVIDGLMAAALKT